MSTGLDAAGTDFYVPTYRVRVGGSPIDRQAVRDILSVTYTDALDNVDSFTLEINNWDQERRTTLYSEGDLFSPGQRVQAEMGYMDAMFPMFTGQITTLQPKFPAAGPPTLTVGGLSILHGLRQAPHSLAWEDKTDGEIANKIAGGLGVEIEVTSSAAVNTRRDYVLQNNLPDIAFLLQRGRLIGYELTAQERPSGTVFLRYAPRDRSGDVTYLLEWGRSLLSFDPRISTAGQVGSVTVRAAHPTEGRTIEVTVQRGELGGASPYLSSYQDRAQVITDRPVASDAEAREVGLERLRQIAQKEVTASITTVGLPRLRAGARVKVKGVGARYLDGTYFVTGTTHTLGGNGYVTTVQAEREVPE